MFIDRPVVVHVAGAQPTEAAALAVFLSLEGFEASSSRAWADALAHLAKSDTDILLLDTDVLHGHSIIAATKRVRQIGRCRSIILACNQTECSQTSAACIEAVLLKPFDAYQVLISVIAVLRSRLSKHPEDRSDRRSTFPDPVAVARVRQALSPRQLQVLASLSRGLSNKRIALELGISQRTVDNHRLEIMRRLDAHNSVDLGRIIGEMGGERTSPVISSTVDSHQT